MTEFSPAAGGRKRIRDVLSVCKVCVCECVRESKEETEGINCTDVSITGLKMELERFLLTMTTSSSATLLANTQSDNYIHYIEERM